MKFKMELKDNEIKKFYDYLETVYLLCNKSEGIILTITSNNFIFICKDEKIISENYSSFNILNLHSNYIDFPVFKYKINLKICDEYEKTFEYLIIERKEKKNNQIKNDITFRMNLINLKNFKDYLKDIKSSEIIIEAENLQRNENNNNNFYNKEELKIYKIMLNIKSKDTIILTNYNIFLKCIKNQIYNIYNRENENFIMKCNFRIKLLNYIIKDFIENNNEIIIFEFEFVEKFLIFKIVNDNYNFNFITSKFERNFLLEKNKFLFHLETLNLFNIFRIFSKEKDDSCIVTLTENFFFYEQNFTNYGEENKTKEYFSIFNSIPLNLIDEIDLISSLKIE
jgi:hypothetical protein